jgi:hypothetical protein
MVQENPASTLIIFVGIVSLCRPSPSNSAPSRQSSDNLLPSFIEQCRSDKLHRDNPDVNFLLSLLPIYGPIVPGA